MGNRPGRGAGGERFKVASVLTAIGSSNWGPSFLKLPTAFPTGHIRRTSSGAGRSNELGSPSVSPSQSGQSSRSMITGMRSCIPTSCRFASVVMVAKVCRISPSGDFHLSQMPPKTTGSPSMRATANGVLPSGSSRHS